MTQVIQFLVLPNCGRHRIPSQRDFNLGHTLDVSPSVADKLTCNQFVT